MKALTWNGKRDVRIEDVADPNIREPTDAVVRITTVICGSDLHLYEVLGPFMEEGDTPGHEPMGIVEEVGPEVTNLSPGDGAVTRFRSRVVTALWTKGASRRASTSRTQCRPTGRRSPLPLDEGPHG